MTMSSRQAVASAASSENVAISRNYAYVLVGGFFFPLMIAAHMIARKKRHESQGIGRSHYRFQFRTTSFALIATVIVLCIGAAMVFGVQRPASLQQAEEKTWIIFLLNVSWLVFLWVAARCIRGLYLAGASREIQNPKTLWIWP